MMWVHLLWSDWIQGQVVWDGCFSSDVTSSDSHQSQRLDLIINKSIHSATTVNVYTSQPTAWKVKLVFSTVKHSSWFCLHARSELKGIVLSKNEKSVITYSTLCHFKAFFFLLWRWCFVKQPWIPKTCIVFPQNFEEFEICLKWLGFPKRKKKVSALSSR